MPGDERLQRIQALQFTDRPAAEALVLDFVRDLFPDLAPVAAELRPLAVSLNSFNGFLTLADGRRLFFKTHVEPDSIVGEYYNAEMLARAGYPVIRPLHVSTEYGKQFLIYEKVDAPSVFDVARAIERGERGPADLEALAEAQTRADAQLYRRYEATWADQSADEAARAPIHQLFYHRLGARYAQFYAGKPFALPGDDVPWERLLEWRWTINGLRYPGALGEAIEAARALLRPDQAGPSVVGHGDAHNGNVFLTAGGLVYFDPAFGGRHHPLLDLAKPLFHNVFAAWMYHPAEVAATLDLRWRFDGRGGVEVRHTHLPSPVRAMFLHSKVGQVLAPALDRLP
ncbi:MAG: phosphotransferase, partial [Anaerolineae bacterium]|nr:phosphotransferase [Anaerolineae bacterium]